MLCLSSGKLSLLLISSILIPLLSRPASALVLLAPRGSWLWYWSFASWSWTGYSRRGSPWPYRTSYRRLSWSSCRSLRTSPPFSLFGRRCSVCASIQTLVRRTIASQSSQSTIAALKAVRPCFASAFIHHTRRTRVTCSPPSPHEAHRRWNSYLSSSASEFRPASILESWARSG